MVPEPGEYISLLMGAPDVSEADLERAGVRVLERFAPGLLGVLVGPASVEPYLELVRAKLPPGFWTDLVGRDEIRFVFKLRDGSLEEHILGEANIEEIARLCSDLNGDPLERTLRIYDYFAANAFYREVMVACYGVRPA